MVDDTSQEADFITIVSSEMIADVMQDYFNKHMYKKKVAIVDLKPTESGYMFSLSFVLDKKTQFTQGPTEIYTDHGFVPVIQPQNGVGQSRRDNKGKFTSGNSKQTVKG